MLFGGNRLLLATVFIYHDAEARNIQLFIFKYLLIKLIAIFA